jgi:hypothetical protein
LHSAGKRLFSRRRRISECTVRRCDKSFRMLEATGHGGWRSLRVGYG